MKRSTLTFIFFLILILAWAVCTGCFAFMGLDIQLWSPYVIPSPTFVVEYLWENTMNGKIPEATLITMRRLFIGYLIGLVIGVPMGMLAARFRCINDTLGVLALGLQALPSVCWVPLACIWFGQDEVALLFVVVMGSLWSVLLSTQNGMRNVPPIYSRAARTMGASQLYTLIHVTLPASAPFLVSGMKQGWAFAWRSLMAAEIYVAVASGFGLGQHLHYGRELHRMHQVIGIMIIIIAIGLLADKILFAPAEKWLHRRWGTDKN